MRQLRRDMQLIFQDPFGSLNPRMTVANIVGESLSVHGIARGRQRFEQVRELLVKVGLADHHGSRYPPRILRRTATAYRHRPCFGPQSTFYRL